MTFKGMLKIMINDYKKQHEAKMFSVVNELLQTRRELAEVREQLRLLQLNSTINLSIQYHGVLYELSDIHRTITIKELLIQLRQITGIPLEQPIRISVLSEDGLTTLFYLDQELNRTLETSDTQLKSRMILIIEDDNSRDIYNKQNLLQPSKSFATSERTYSYESDV